MTISSAKDDYIFSVRMFSFTVSLRLPSQNTTIEAADTNVKNRTTLRDKWRQIALTGTTTSAFLRRSALIFEDLHMSIAKPSSYLLFHDGLLIGVKKVPLFPQRVVLQPWSGPCVQRRQRGTFLWGFLFFPLRAIVPLGLSLHSTCGVQGSDGCWSRHRRIGLLSCVPV